MPDSFAATAIEDLACAVPGLKVSLNHVGDSFMTTGVDGVLEFWFDSPPTDEDGLARQMKQWFSSESAIDAEMSSRFGTLMSEAAAGHLDSWGETACGRLALILLLDQCPRNTHRGDPAAFAQDELALSWTLNGISNGMDRQLESMERMFFYMPMQHSECLDVQEQSVERFAELARGDLPRFMRKSLSDSEQCARLHQEIIARFGRFPHRNAILGRESTADERDYLERGAPAFGQQIVDSVARRMPVGVRL